MKPALSELSGCLVTLAIFVVAPLTFWWWADRPISDPPDVTLAVSDLASAYFENEVAADSQWKGLTIAVTGRAARVGKLDGPTMAIELTDGVGTVRCRIGSHQHDAVASIQSGDWIRVVGKLLGIKGGAPTLRKCRIDAVGHGVAIR